MSFLRNLSLKVSNRTKSLAVLIDPDGVKKNDLGLIVDIVNAYDIDFFLVGGSLLLEDELDKTIKHIKRYSDKPVVLFPGSEIQLHDSADALLFLSLISGRNSEYLISKHVAAAPRLRKMDIEIIPTGYMLVHHRQYTSTVSYITGTTPIPMDKPEISGATALAGQYLGQKLIYLEGGSGAIRPVSNATIKAVKEAVNVPIIVGGGIKTPQQMHSIFKSGADVQVVGTSIEKNPKILKEFAKIKNEFNQEHSIL